MVLAPTLANSGKVIVMRCDASEQYTEVKHDGEVCKYESITSTWKGFLCNAHAELGAKRVAIRKIN